MSDQLSTIDAETAESGRFAGLFTLEELVALTDGVGMPAPWFTRSLLSPDTHGDAVDALAQLGRSSLLVRGLVRRSGDSFTTSSALQELAHVLSEPLLAVGVARVMEDRVRIWSFVARPNSVVGHALSDLGTHRLSLFPTSDLLPAIVEASGLRRSEPSEAEDVGLDTDLVQKMIDQAEGSTVGRSDDLDALLAAGFDEGSAALIARFTRESESGSVVTVLRPDSGHSVVGTVTAWIDAGDDGLWLVDEGDSEAGDTPTTRLGPTSGDAILASIVGGLPSID